MIETWQLQPAPSDRDPRRFGLRVKAAPSGLHGLLRKLGPACGRPRPAPPPFSHLIYIGGLSESDVQELRSALLALSPRGELSPRDGAARAARAPARPEPEAFPEPLPGPPPRPKAEPELPTLDPAKAPKADTGPELPTLAPARSFPAAAPPPAAEEAPAFPTSDAALPTLDPLKSEGPPPAPPLPEPPAPLPEPPPPVPEPPAALEPPAPSPEPPAPAFMAPLPEAPAPAFEAPVPMAPAFEPPAPPPMAAEPPSPPEISSPAPEALASGPVPAFEPPAPPPPPPPPPPAPPAPAGILGGVKEETPVPGQTPLPGVSPVEVIAEPRWGLEWALEPNRTFDQLQIGPHNRFAHAASMSVVTSVGAMYNPLALHGGPCSGKSHFINAIASQLSTELAGAVVRTSGIRLGLAAGREGEGLLKKLAAVKVLLVDDLDRLQLGETNKPVLAKLMKTFLAKDRQLVVSVGGNEADASALYAALGLGFPPGWKVELKKLGAAAFKSVGSQLVDAFGLKLDPAQGQVLLEKAGGSLAELVPWLRRLKAFQEAGSKDPLPALLERLTVPPDAGGLDPHAASEFRWPKDPGGAAALGVFYPGEHKGPAKLLLSKVHEACGKYGLAGHFAGSASESYDAESFKSAAKIADEADRAGFAAALVLGPPPGAGLVRLEAEFEDALRRSVPHLLIRLAYVSFDKAEAPGSIARAAIDLTNVTPWTF